MTLARQHHRRKCWPVATCLRSVASLRKSCDAGSRTSPPTFSRPTSGASTSACFKVTGIATSRVPDGAPGHSILHHDCQTTRTWIARRRVRKSLHAAHPLSPRVSSLESLARQSRIGIGSPGSVSSLGFRSRRSKTSTRNDGSALAMSRHRVGDHLHSCKKRSGSTKAAHETILDAVEAVCHQAGLVTERATSRPS